MREQVRESERGSSSSYSSVCPPLNDRPDLLCHASASQLKTSLVRFNSHRSSLAHSLCLLSVAVGPFHHLKMIKVGQIGLELRHVTQKQRWSLITSRVERFNIKYFSKVRGCLLSFICWLRRADDSPEPGAIRLLNFMTELSPYFHLIK